MLFDDITGVLGGAQSWVEQQWTQRIVQISVYAAILFFVLSSFDLINKVDGFIVKSLNVKLGKEGTRALHAATLGFFMFVGVKFILDPFVHKFVNGKTVEGQVGQLESDAINKAVEDAEEVKEVKETFSPTILFGHPDLEKYIYCKGANNYLNELYSNGIDANIVYRLFGGSGGIELGGIIKSFEEKCPEYND
jgi:hypothetical protein